LAAWWEGWKRPSTTYQRDSTKLRVNPHPSHQVSILAAWWEGWKESTTPQLFSCSSLTLLFYLLLLYYMVTESLLYSVPPVLYDLSNPSPDLLSPHHHPIPTGSMGGWVKVPDHYSSIPRAPPWQHRTGTWAIQHNATILQLIQRIIVTKIRQSTSTTYSNPFPTPKVTMQSRVFQDPVRIFNPG
jgi:hypothetical protein